MGAGEKNGLVAAEVMPEGFYEYVSGVLDDARRRAYTAVNFAMVEAYWEIGRSIVEQQGGAERAEYGEALLGELSRRLTEDFGKGFDERNLRFMRQFYLAFPIRNALRTELSWTHYRRLSRVADPEARMWYMNECAKSNWSTRQLERQINTMFRERLLASRDKEAVAAEVFEKETPRRPEDIIRDPYVLEFLGISQDEKFRETDIESALISHLPSKEELALELSAEYRALDEAGAD